jgi:hypothetical protein
MRRALPIGQTVRVLSLVPERPHVVLGSELAGQPEPAPPADRLPLQCQLRGDTLPCDKRESRWDGDDLSNCEGSGERPAWPFIGDWAQYLPRNA